MFHFRPINDSLMPFTPTYSPVRHAPATAGTQLATTCRYARYAEPLPPRPTANYSLLTANSSFAFSAKERDSETGLSYFGSRYYSSDLSIWLSVDPMSDKYASLSPYVYCADNPVKLTDSDGRWIPGLDEDNNIIVTREEGDDINSFKKFMGSAYSDDETNNMYGQMQNGRINLTKTYGKEFQIMTDAINDAYNDPTFEDNKNYNCWGMAIAVTKCVKVQGNGPDDLDGVGRNLNSFEQFDNCLSNGYSQGGAGIRLGWKDCVEVWQC